MKFYDDMHRRWKWSPTVYSHRTKLIHVIC